MDARDAGAPATRSGLRSSPTAVPASSSRSTRWPPTGPRWSRAPTASSATCGSPRTVTWSACTTDGSTGPPTAAGSSPPGPSTSCAAMTSARGRTTPPGATWARTSTGPRPPDPERSEVITLEQLLELVVDAGRPVGLAIETKHPTRYAGLVEERLVEVLAHYGLTRPRFGSLGDAGAVTGLLPGPRSARRCGPNGPSGARRGGSRAGPSDDAPPGAGRRLSVPWSRPRPTRAGGSA